MRKYDESPIINRERKKTRQCFLILKGAGCGVRTHAHLCAEDLKSSPLTSRANQLAIISKHQIKNKYT